MAQLYSCLREIIFRRTDVDNPAGKRCLSKARDVMTLLPDREETGEYRLLLVFHTRNVVCAVINRR